MQPTVLIVDDHAGYRAAARMLLESEGFEVVGESATGQEALAHATELQPMLVLLDIGLPDLDGISVAEVLTARQHPPMVVLTSSRDGAGCDNIFAACGARGFIPKSELTGDALAALAA